MHKRKKSLWLAAIPAIVLLASGCAASGPDAGGASSIGGELTSADDEALGGTDAVAELTKLYDAAIAAGQTTVTVYGPGEIDKVPVYEKFAERFPGITVNGVFMVGPDYAAKLQGEVASGNHVGDLVQSGDTSVVDQIPAGYFEKFDPVTAEGLGEDYKDSTDTVHAASATAFGYLYNTDALSAEEAPAGWEDLLDPSLKGQFASDTVTHFGGGFSTLAHLNWDGRLGDDYLDQLGAQDFRMESNTALAGTDVATGQAAVEPFYPLSYYLRDKANGAPVGFVFPTEGGVHISPHYLGLVKGAPNPDAAKLLMTWLFTPEGQQACADIGYYPLMPGAPGPEGYPAEEELDLFKPFPLEAVTDISNDNLDKVGQAFG
ncbi:ABC transporter substrate-binding protein [Herbiconiux daphne]|uniref:Extracellular solute-binding protein n=1 Tax=Herbiconiux daphne TaxID=2970914 RepID=A0ABT2H3N8_9MICO|nr:extracellular solute-binding protein [Herbiconiux daphne]MCS5734516.1 extracellular solute-binding protein [Herbiconiux daphne]